jgi:dTDP-glucose pyrophosphorylase
MISPLQTLTLTATLRDAVRVIEESRRTIAIIVDGAGRLAGTASDGDIRRAILRGLTLDTAVRDAMNTHPIVGQATQSDAELLRLLQSRDLEALPIVTEDGVVTRVVHIDELRSGVSGVGGGEGYAAAVIMAGGEGRRLMPLTRDKPKPMIDVGGQPVIERLVRDLARARIARVYVAINYLSHLIEDHLGDGSLFDVEIRYLREQEKMGTAGALSLLPERPTAPLLVINGDVLTASDYGSLLAYHQEHGAFITVGAIQYLVNIPFGVLRNAGPQVTAIEEKPSQSFLCNAGIYVLSPDAVTFVSTHGRLDMTDLIKSATESGRMVAVFPIHEYWADIGSQADLDRARSEVFLLERRRG